MSDDKSMLLSSSWSGKRIKKYSPTFKNKKYILGEKMNFNNKNNNNNINKKDYLIVITIYFITIFSTFLVIV